LNDITPTDISTWRIMNQPLLDGGEGKIDVVSNPVAPLTYTVEWKKGDEKGIKQLAIEHVEAELGNKNAAPSTSWRVDGVTTHHLTSFVTGSEATGPRPSPLGGDDGSTTSATGQAIPSNTNAMAGLAPPTDKVAGLAPPTINANLVVGAQTDHLRKVNKSQRVLKQRQQLVEPTWWTTHEGKFVLPDALPPVPHHRNHMCPSGLAAHHPAAETLLQYATGGCPVNTGRPWTIQQMQAAIDRGPHISALAPDAAKQLDLEVAEKVAKGQARLIKWSDIKHNPPKNLKISPVAMVPHKSCPYRAILDLSYSIRLSPIDAIPSVNSTTIKTAPKGSISQIGHSLGRIIHAFAAASDDSVIFMAKWDIKDGFWRLDCVDGEEYSFAYVLPSSHGGDTTLVVPTSLQMGWIESPPYFCAASETARDVAAQYAELPLVALPDHQFIDHTRGNADREDLPQYASLPSKRFCYLLEVYVDDFIGIVIPVSQQQLDHVATSIMSGIHDVFPPAADTLDDPISHKKLLKGEGQWASVKEILGMTFDSKNKTIWLTSEKRDALISLLKQWMRIGSKRGGIPFDAFRSILAKLQHAFLTIPARRGLLSPFYTILAIAPRFVFPHKNVPLTTAIVDC
jgi:hypothetical protein